MTPNYTEVRWTWVCSMISVALVAVRLVMRRVRRQKFKQGDFWCLLAAMVIFARVVGDHLLLVYGATRIMPLAQRVALIKSGDESAIRKVIIGSKLAVVTRAQLIIALWSCKMAVLDLLATLIRNMPYERPVLYTYWGVFFITFSASFIIVFTECPQFNDYWKILPDPGPCPVGVKWLLDYEICNISTDVMLMVLAFYIIMSIKISLGNRLRIAAVFSVGFLLISISIVRIVEGYSSIKMSIRTPFSAMELMFAVVVAVVPTLYGLIRNTNQLSSAHGNAHPSQEDAHHEQSRRSKSMSVKYNGSEWLEFITENEVGGARSQGAVA